MRTICQSIETPRLGRSISNEVQESLSRNDCLIRMAKLSKCKDDILEGEGWNAQESREVSAGRLSHRPVVTEVQEYYKKRQSKQQRFYIKTQEMET